MRTMSTSMSAEDASQMAGSVHDLLKEREDANRAAIREGRATAGDYRESADTLRQRGEFKEAEKIARAAVALEDGSAEAWRILGLTLVRRENFSEAIGALERSVALNPNDVMTMRFLSICYLKVGDETRGRDMRTRADALSGGEIPWRE